MRFEFRFKFSVDIDLVELYIRLNIPCIWLVAIIYSIKVEPE